MRTLAIISALCLASGLACKKQEKNKAKEASPAPAEKPAEVTPPPADTAATAAADPAKSTPERPATITDEQVKTVDELVDGFGAMVTALEAAKTDCKAMAKTATAESAKVKDKMKKLKEMQEAIKADAAAKAWFDATYKDKMDAELGRLMTAVEPCKSDKAVMAAVKDIGPTKVESPDTAPAAAEDAK